MNPEGFQSLQNLSVQKEERLAYVVGDCLDKPLGSRTQQ